MRTHSRKYLMLLAASVVYIALHSFAHNHLLSYVTAPVALATFMAFTVAPAPVVVLLALGAELFSFLPPGVMALVVLLPFGARRIFARTEPELSGSFLAAICSTFALQLLVVALAGLLPVWQTADTWGEIWIALPLIPFAVAVALSSLITYAGIVLWYEMFPPQQDSVTTSLRRSSS